MPFARLRDIRLYYNEAAPPPDHLQSQTPIVFLHGFTIDRRMWQPQMEYLSRRYRVIAVDARGHGLSDATDTDYGRNNRVQDLLEFAYALRIKSMHLVGLSMGGSTAIGFALKHQEYLQSMTLISTGAAGYSPGKKIDFLTKIAREQGADAVMKRWKEIALSWYHGDKAEIKALMKTMMDDHSGKPWVDPRRGHYPRTNDLDHVHKITTPTLILAGALDRIFVPLAEQLHEKISNSTLKIYDNTGHMLNLESPEHCNRDLDEFLQTVDS